jgi:hypothetical protein
VLVNAVRARVHGKVAEVEQEHARNLSHLEVNKISKNCAKVYTERSVKGNRG